MIASVTSQCSSMVANRSMISRIYVLRRLIEEKYITNMEWGPGDLNIADPLTKSCNAGNLITACSMNILPLPVGIESGKKRNKKFKYIFNNEKEELKGNPEHWYHSNKIEEENRDHKEIQILDGYGTYAAVSEIIQQ